MNLVQRIAIGGAALFATCGVLQAATSDVVEEIVVTAQKREQSVQDVPIAITAFTAETLQTKGVADIGALTRLTPNVNLDTGSPFSGDTSVLSASIRGIGQDDFAFNLDPGVGVYLDGVYLARTIGANQSLLDIDRIEILKGPQGTLFGRNSIGGAISIVTHTPGSEPRFIATATTGSYSRRDLSATADIPLSESFLTSISFSSQVRDGYQKVIPYPNTTEMGNVPYFVDDQTAFPKAGYATSDTKGGQNLQVIRGKALWKASDAVNVTFAADYSHQNQSSYPTTVLDVTTVPQGYGGLGALYNLCISVPAAVLDDPDGPFGRTAQGMPTPGPGPFNTSPTGVCGIRGSHPTATGLPPLAPGGAPLGGAGYVGGPDPYGSPANPSSAAPRIYWNMANTQTGDIDTTYANGPSFAKYDAWVRRRRSIGRSPTACRSSRLPAGATIDWKVGVDLDGMPESIQEVTDHQSQDQFSQEFQLTGKAFDSKLDYVAGLYYFQEEGFVHDFVAVRRPRCTSMTWRTTWIPSPMRPSSTPTTTSTTASASRWAHATRRTTDVRGRPVGSRWLHLQDQWLLRPGGLRQRAAEPLYSGRCHLPAGARLHDARAARSLLPGGGPEAELHRLHADDRRAVARQQRRDAVPELLERLQGGRLDDAPVGADSGHHGCRLRSGVREDVRTRFQVGVLRSASADQYRGFLQRLHGHPVEFPGRPFAGAAQCG